MSLTVKPVSDRERLRERDCCCTSSAHPCCDNKRVRWQKTQVKLRVSERVIFMTKAGCTGGGSCTSQDTLSRGHKHTQFVRLVKSLQSEHTQKQTHHHMPIFLFFHFPCCHASVFVFEPVAMTGNQI